MFNLVISIICFQLILELDAEPIKEHNVWLRALFLIFQW